MQPLQVIKTSMQGPSVNKKKLINDRALKQMKTGEAARKVFEKSAPMKAPTVVESAAVLEGAVKSSAKKKYVHMTFT